jgi:hypothetical protein
MQWLGSGYKRVYCEEMDYGIRDRKRQCWDSRIGGTWDKWRLERDRERRGMSVLDCSGLSVQGISRNRESSVASVDELMGGERSGERRSVSRTCGGVNAPVLVKYRHGRLASEALHLELLPCGT